MSFAKRHQPLRRRTERLPDEDVIAVYYARGPQKAIARDFRIDQSTVSKIKRGSPNYRRITAQWCDAGILGALLVTLAFTGAA